MPGNLSSVPGQFLLLLVLETICALWGGVWGVVPAFFLIWVLYLGWAGLGVVCILVGLVTGILHDILLRGTPGWSSLFYVIAAYVNSFLPGVSPWERVGVILVFSFLYGLHLAYAPHQGFLWKMPAVIRFALLTAMVNLIAVIPVEWFRRRQWTRKDSLGI